MEQNKYKTEIKAKKEQSEQYNMEINKLLSIVELYASSAAAAAAALFLILALVCLCDVIRYDAVIRCDVMWCNA